MDLSSKFIFIVATFLAATLAISGATNTTACIKELAQLTIGDSKKPTPAMPAHFMQTVELPAAFHMALEAHMQQWLDGKK